MNEDPLISGGIVKVALVILATGALGAGAYALVGGGVDLPDIDIDDPTASTTTLSNTNLENTTIDPGGPDAIDPLTSAGFAESVDEVLRETGAGTQATRLFINPVQTQFIVRTGDESFAALSVRADSGDLVRQDATVTISGNATVDDFAYSLEALDPAAIDRMLAAAPGAAGASGFEPAVLSLERAIPRGDRKLEWTVTGNADGRDVVLRADADGKGLRDETGGNPQPAQPEAPLNALSKCIEAAGDDTDKVFDCLGKFN